MKNSNGRIYDCKVNHLRNPLGYRMERTVFSWKVADTKGKHQKAARLIIAKDQQLTKIVSDSGWDEAADSLGYEVVHNLEPRTRYYWTVSVQTDAGEEMTSEVQWYETAKNEELWSGKWITCDNTVPRHPFFEKEVHPSKEVAKARLYVSGLGLYEAYFAGEKIGSECLAPYSNNYNQWIQYQTYDVTKQVSEKGTLSILLGNGWYKGRFGSAGNEERGFYGNEWLVIAELVLTYTDGTEECIGTDESWQVRRSNIVLSNLYDGEHCDDTLPEESIETAILCEAPKGVLTERVSLPVTVHEVFQPVELIATPAGEQVFDLGQEIAGIFTLRVNEPKGTKIHIQFGEILQNGNFYNGNLRTAKAEYIYVSNGEETIIQPHFTYYGYRYVKVQGVSELKEEDFKGLALYSEIEETGDIKTGHELVNKLVSNVRWGLKSNFIDVPTDCPQRDEKMGWTGDAQVFSPTATYLTDTYAFFAKYLYDMWQEQQEANGKVPWVVPSVGINMVSSVWGDAACIMPWNLYLFYGDVSILKDQFASMKAWVDYIRQVDGENHGWRREFHFGDWLSLDNSTGNADDVLGATDEEFIANIYYAISAGLVAKAAAVLGYEAEQKEYQELSKEQFEIVKREYYSVTGRCCVKTQTALLLTLKYHLSDNEELTKEQLLQLFVKNGNKLNTGFIGTPIMCNVLSENGMNELAYKLFLNEDYPGWLHEVKLGATTMWERWNSVQEDGSISLTGMNSLNHYSYGSIVEWLFRHAAGLDFLSEENMEKGQSLVGCRKVVIQPVLDWNLKSLAATYHSPAGEYQSSWEIIDPTHVKIYVKVPFGCTAKLILPHAKEEAVRALTMGEYTIEYETDESLKKGYSTYSLMLDLKNSPEAMQILGEMEIWKQLPDQYLAMSLRQIAGFTVGTMPEEYLNSLDEMLAKI